MNFVQEQLKTNKFIVQHSRQSKDNESFEKKFHPSKENRKKKFQNSNIQNIETFQNGQKIFATAIMKILSVFHINLTPKVVHFYSKEIKVPHVAQKAISSK